jgi:hypothetical protein
VGKINIGGIFVELVRKYAYALLCLVYIHGVTHLKVAISIYNRDISIDDVVQLNV